MKKLSLVLIAFLLFPAMLSAQYKVKAIHQEPVDLKITIPAYSERVPAAVMNARFEFDQETETLVVRLNKGLTNCEYDKVWLPQHSVTVFEIGSYMKARGVKLKKAQTFSDQENFLNLSSRTLAASVDGKGMTFNGVYDLHAPKKVKKQFDHQLVPLDGKMELVLSFKIEKKARQVTLTLHNPIPMNRKGKKGIAAYVADDVVINIELNRCKDAEQAIQAIQEYEAMFRVAEDKINSYRKSPSTQKAYRDFVLSMYDEIDITRFEAMGCDEVQDSYDNLIACIDRIQGTKPIPNPDPNPNPNPNKVQCDVKKLNAEISSTTDKLNELVNDYSIASDAATKAEKKAAFDATVQRFDAKLNELPADCKKNLDSKLLKNYEFVKKLIK